MFWRRCEKIVVAYFTVLTLHMFGQTEENYVKVGYQEDNRSQRVSNMTPRGFGDCYLLVC